MRNIARQTRENRTITIDFHDETTYFRLLDDGKAFVELGMAFILSLGMQPVHPGLRIPALPPARHDAHASMTPSSRRP
jgi:hypothetical protein